LYSATACSLCSTNTVAARASEVDGLSGHLQHEVDAARQDDDVGRAGEQVVEICSLNARVVTHSGLSPVPLLDAARDL
jgi:hypothetical protein